MAELFELEEEVLRMNCEIHHKYGSFLSDTMTGKQHIPVCCPNECKNVVFIVYPTTDYNMWRF